MLLAGCVVADGTPEAGLRPEQLAEAFGGRLLRIGDETLPGDDHHHHDDVGHRRLHQREHAADQHNG